MCVCVCVHQVLVDNFVHGDLHPGNILVQSMAGGAAGAGDPGGAGGRTTLTDLWDTVVVSVRPCPDPLQLVLLDAGIVAQLSDTDLRNFRAVFTAVVLKQVRRRMWTCTLMSQNMTIFSGQVKSIFRLDILNYAIF